MDKKRERIHIDHFNEICGLFPNDEIEKNREKPDFIVHTAGKLLGIEHTEIFQPETSDGGSLQALDQMAQRVVKHASDLYVHNHNQPLYVQIMFRPRIFLNQQKVDQLAEMIYQLIKITPLSPGTHISLKRTQENSGYFPREIWMIRLYSAPNIRENNWFCSSPGIKPALTADYLQKWISKKEGKVDEYRSKCSELWLLIVVDESRNPSTMDISWDASIHCYRTKFDRVFIFWNASRYKIELQLTK